jgi:hypothetical protein
MVRYIVLGVLAGLMTGCTQTAWIRPGATQADFAADRDACIRDANGGYFGYGINAQLNYQGYVERCLRARGYTLEAINTRQGTL